MFHEVFSQSKNEKNVHTFDKICLLVDKICSACSVKICSVNLDRETTFLILYWTDSKIQAAFESAGKPAGRKTNFNDLGVTSDVTGQVKVKMFDFSGLVTSASKISMLSSNKANE